MNVPVVSHLKLLVNLYNKMNNRFLVLLVIYLIIYLLSVLYKNKQIFCAILLSLLSWERGLKCGDNQCCHGACVVAPLVGAWIEIDMERKANADNQSLLSWERGLKLPRESPLTASCIVAPLVGAWIEIIKKHKLNCQELVAPLVGAWIEISGDCAQIGSSGSLLSWERGLKFIGTISIIANIGRSSRGSVD